MTRKVFYSMLALVFCLSVSLIYGQDAKDNKKPGPGKPATESKPKPELKLDAKPKREPEAIPGNAGKPRTDQPGPEPAAKPRQVGKPQPKEGAKAPDKGPGGAWSERTHSGKQSGEQPPPKGAEAGQPTPKKATPQKSATEGAAPGTAAAKHNAPKGSGAEGATSGYAAVRKSFNQPNMYGRQWFDNHPNAWFPAGWSAGTVWTVSPWTSVVVFMGYGNVTPISYDYGDNVTYQNGSVWVDGENVGTASLFSQQAADLAQTGIDAQISDTNEWLPLGVFALVRNEREHPHRILQFAIDKQGILRGNYTDDISGQTSPIIGAIDEKTQRAAWIVGNNRQSVMEAGLKNLTEGEAPVLIHRNGRTDHLILVRLNNDDASDNRN